MSKKRKRLERLRQNPKNVTFEDLRTVLEDYGFTLERSSGSHHSFKVKLGDEYILLVIPYRRPIKPNYVKDALAIIDEIMAAQTSTEESDEDEEKENG